MRPSRYRNLSAQCYKVAALCALSFTSTHNNSLTFGRLSLTLVSFLHTAHTLVGFSHTALTYGTRCASLDDSAFVKMFRPKWLEQMDCGLESEMVSTPHIISPGPGSSSSHEMSATSATNCPDTQELVAVPGPKAGEEEVGFMGQFGLDGFSDRYTKGTEGTLTSPMSWDVHH